MSPIDVIAACDPSFLESLSEAESLAALVVLGELELPASPPLPRVPRRSPGRLVRVRERDLRRAARAARELSRALEGLV